MQGFETASLANDACGVPLPWNTISPWFVFDGKLFQLKLRLSSCVQSLHELCDENLETILKIERLKSAILEDAEQFLLPDPLTVPNNFNMAPGNYTGLPMSMLKSVASSGYGPAASVGMAGGPSGLGPIGPRGGSGHFGQGPKNNRNGHNNNPLLRSGMAGLGVTPQKAHQLKVGGIVVGNWASPRVAPQLTNLSTRFNQVGRGRNASQILSSRLNRMPLDIIPQVAQFPHHNYGAAAAMNRAAAFNMRGLGGMGVHSLGGGGGGVGAGLSGINGLLGKSMKSGGGVGKNRKGNKQANAKKQNGKKKNKPKKDAKENKNDSSAGAAAADGLTERLAKSLSIAEEADYYDSSSGEGAKNGRASSRLVDSELVAEICDGVLKEDDDVVDDEDALLGAGASGGSSSSSAETVAPAGGKKNSQPKHILTKKKLIAIGGSQETQGDALLLFGNTNKADRRGQGDA